MTYLVWRESFFLAVHKGDFPPELLNYKSKHCLLDIEECYDKQRIRLVNEFQEIQNNVALTELPTI